MCRYIETDDLKEKLANVTHDYWVRASDDRIISKYWNFADEAYYLPVYGEILGIVKANKVKKPKVSNESFDCDDFSFALKGKICEFTRDNLNVEHSMCFGIAWGTFDWADGYHCCNWVFDSDRTFWWVEPRDRKFHPIEECEELKLLLV